MKCLHCGYVHGDHNYDYVEGEFGNFFTQTISRNKDEWTILYACPSCHKTFIDY